MSPQRAFHYLVVELIGTALRAVAPSGWLIRKHMSVVLGSRDRVEPDVLVVRADAEVNRAVTSYPAEAVLLAVEVVSPESEARDRERKPQLYARAGIPHFWRIEETADEEPVFHIFELDRATGTYALSGIHHERLTLTDPFPIDVSLDLTSI